MFSELRLHNRGKKEGNNILQQMEVQIIFMYWKTIQIEEERETLGA